MKSIIKNGESATINYPCLKIYNNDNNLGGYVVLFTSPQKGVVVFSKNRHKKIGEDEKTDNNLGWAEDRFLPFNGTIELSNN